MLELKGLPGVLYGVSEWVMRLSAVNLIWFLMSLPLFVLLLTFDMGSQVGIVLFAPASWLLGSLLFFPATAAVFATARDWVLDTGQSSVLRTYFSHLKRDYKDSAKMGGGFAVLWLGWYYANFFFQSESSFLAFMFLLSGSSLFIYTINFLSISAHYRMSGGERLKNAFFVSAGSPLMGLSILLSCGLLLWISMTQLLWLLPFLTCSLIAFLSFAAFHKFTMKVEEKRRRTLDAKATM